jgi:hypothetical protein
MRRGTHLSGLLWIWLARWHAGESHVMRVLVDG